MKLISLFGLLPFALTSAAFAAPLSTYYTYSYNVVVDTYWSSATVYYLTDSHEVWHYTLPCKSVYGYAYECSAVTPWGAPVVYSYYPTYTTLAVYDTVYTCYSYHCY